MSQTSDPSDKNRKQYVFNLTLAAVAGQVGCLTTVIVLAAMLVGLWLDNQFGTRLVFTIIFLVGSVPVTVVTMLWVVRKATAKIKPISKSEETQTTQEE
jgi:F0F1-type ATP synthase assembly protein I